MSNIKCLNCKNTVSSKKEFKKGLTVICDKCGVAMICLDHNQYISRWRIKNIRGKGV